MADQHVVVENLVKIYPGAIQPSVDTVNFSLPRGEMLALLGPSGCGKTTILRMIAGLVEPSSGAIRLEGRDVSAIPVHKRGLGMVFQAYALFPHMTVAENISFGLEMRKVGKAEREERVAKALDLVKLSGLGGRKINQLSGGQQQRAAIARSLVIEPALLLLDEPLSNLDAKLRDEMRDEIRDIQARTGVTAIFVTHDQDEALSMADRLAVMSNGKIQQIGTPRDIFDRPATDFVARFIGAGNFFDGKVVGGRSAEVEGLGTVHYNEDTPSVPAVRLLLRPHRITVGAPEATGANHFNGTVEQVVYRGEILSLTIAIGPYRLHADSPTRAGIVPHKGDRVGVSIAPDDVTVIPGAAK